MRAKPILSLTLLAAALGLPGMAASVGLGRMTLQSSLGQPLSAQIELTSVTNEDLGSLTARVADSSLYRQNGLTYQGVLSRARVHGRAPAQRRRGPQGDDGIGRRRAVSRPAGRGELGIRPRRARLHVPARSSRNARRRRRSSRSRRARAGAAAPAPAMPSGAPAATGQVPAARGARQAARPATPTAFGAATRCRGSPANTSRPTRRSSRCWSRSTTAIRTPSTAT